MSRAAMKAEDSRDEYERKGDNVDYLCTGIMIEKDLTLYKKKCYM